MAPSRDREAVTIDYCQTQIQMTKTMHHSGERGTCSYDNSLSIMSPEMCHPRQAHGSIYLDVRADGTQYT
jgi:hypothetical protein